MGSTDTVQRRLTMRIVKYSRTSEQSARWIVIASTLNLGYKMAPPPQLILIQGEQTAFS